MGAVGMHVVLLTESEVLRIGLRTLLERMPEIGAVSESPYTPQAAEAFDFTGVDVLMLSCPRQEWARGTANRASVAGAKVLLLLDDLSLGDSDAAAGVAVDGILPKRAVSAETLAGAFEQMDRGGLPMPAEFSRVLLAGRSATAERRAPLAALTSREQETLALLVDGLSNKLIARRLRISEHGAKRLVASILAKLNCPNRTQAVSVALREGLVPGPARATNH